MPGEDVNGDWASTGCRARATGGGGISLELGPKLRLSEDDEDLPRPDPRDDYKKKDRINIY